MKVTGSIKKGESVFFKDKILCVQIISNIKQ